ncbi:Zn-dependent hydrolase [Paracandidimonas soli]|uniref:Zn-dependent hydrolase n=1 Tax=Paracandidimonas soli TaxID=1917182 RepID=UPI0033404668
MTFTPPASLTAAIARSERIFAQAAQQSADARGVTRMAYGDSETRMLALLEEHAGEIGLQTGSDPAGNLYMTLPGADRSLPIVLTGSHADSVPQGGNYDGLAGILAGMAVLESLAADGFRPSRDLAVVAFRGEENAWFGAQHLGSRAALGLISSDALTSAHRSHDGMRLDDCMRSQGVDPIQLTSGDPFLTPGNVKCYVEAHIEQGPVLLQAGIPVGIVSGIRGNVRCPQASCHGEYGHAGVVPLALRRDAVAASCRLVTQMQSFWEELEAQGHDLVLTFGKLHTDPAAHAVTTISGRVDFSFEARSHSVATLDLVQERMLRLAQEISDACGVTFSFPKWTRGQPAEMDAHLIQSQRDALQVCGTPFQELASGAGHDAQDFVAAGIPAAMFFIRNANGSHNPDESMEMDDYAATVAALLHVLKSESA